MNRLTFADSLTAGALHPKPAAQSAIAALAKSDYRSWSGDTPQKHLIESIAGGTAFFGQDGDGWLDILFVNGAGPLEPMPDGRMPGKSKAKHWNRLFHKGGDGTFTGIAI
jgi:hypothetical protein